MKEKQRGNANLQYCEIARQNITPHSKAKSGVLN
jgi:hypothetical protein